MQPVFLSEPTRRAMLRTGGVAVGAAGIPPFLGGFVLVRRANVRLRRSQSLRRNW